MTRRLDNKLHIFIAWCSYDWACSAFPIIITTFVFAPYFTTSIAVNEIIGTHQWSNATALAGILIAILSPTFGAIADYYGRHKLWLLFFTIIPIICSALLWFAYPQQGFANFTLACVVIGTVGVEIGSVFYNSFLPRIAPPGYLGRISGWAWGASYIGGLVILLIALFCFINAEPSWLNTQTAGNIRINGPLVAAWLMIFSLPLFIFIPETPHSGLSLRYAVTRGLVKLIDTLKSLPKEKNLFLYLIAHLFYEDGLNTLFAFTGIYAAGTIHMSLNDIILLGISVNFVAGVGSVLFGWLDDSLGSKFVILISIICCVLIGIPILFISDQLVFWILCLSLSLFLGPVQAASRSLMARLVPLEKSTELFGLYGLSGRITAFIGPWLLGYMTLYFNSQRAGMATILVFFIVGGFLMCFVKE